MNVSEDQQVKVMITQMVRYADALTGDEAAAVSLLLAAASWRCCLRMGPAETAETLSRVLNDSVQEWRRAHLQ